MLLLIIMLVAFGLGSAVFLAAVMAVAEVARHELD